MIGDMNWRKWEPFVIAGIAFSMMAINFLPSILFTLNVPKDRDYIPIHNSLSDYPYYTSIISQGIDGQTIVFDRETSEQHSGGYIHMLYLAIGWVGKVTGYHDANGLYHGARLILGFVWMYVMYRFIKVFVQTSVGRITAFFFAVCGAGFLVIGEWQGVSYMAWPLDWWTEFNPILRAAFLPHYLAGHSLFVAGLLSFIGFIRKGNVKYLISGTLCGVLSSIIHPPSYLMVGLLVPSYGFLSKRFKRTLFAIIGIGLGIIPLLYYRNLYSVFPWTLASSYERLSFSVPLISYVLGLGPVLLLGFTGFILRIRKKETWIFLLWVIVPSACVQFIWYLLGTRFGPLVSISNLRFLQVAVWLPLAVGAGIAVEKIITCTPRIVGILVCLLLLFITFLGYPMSIQAETRKVYGDYDFQFPKKGYLDAIRFMRTITDPEDVILAMPLAGQIIPTYTNRTIYVGSKEFYTKDLSHKMDEAWAFYGGIFPCDAFSFVENNRITAVFYGFDEKNAGDAVTRYPFLIKKGEFGETEVYGVNKLYEGCY